eukprot:10184960-Lingulodinium_polyedra.AAC.1
MEQIVSHIRQRMPAEYHQGWRQLHRADGDRDTWEVREASLWVATMGPALGFRLPNVQERARISGAA